MARFLFVLDIAFNSRGPSVHLMQDIIRAGLKSGHEIEVILKKTKGGDASIPEDILRNKKFMYFAISCEEEKKFGFLRRYLNEVKYAYKCANVFLKRGAYDAAFLQSNTVAYFYVRLLRRLGCKIIFNVQDIFPYNLKLSKQLPVEMITFPLLRKLQNMAYESVDSLITISDDMKRTLVDDGVFQDKIDVIYNWSYEDIPISLENIENEHICRLPMDCNKFNVVYAGNIGRMQNVELIAKVARFIKNDNSIHFFIIGDGANKLYVEKITNNLPNVTVLPMLEAKYAESIYAQADLNVIPLNKGGIKTALPSKTATILRTNKPVMFCIDRGSKFESIMNKVDGVYFSDCNKILEAKNIIYEVKNREKVEINRSIPFISKKNSSEYIRIMEK